MRNLSVSLEVLGITDVGEVGALSICPTGVVVINGDDISGALVPILKSESGVRDDKIREQTLCRIHPTNLTSRSLQSLNFFFRDSVCACSELTCVDKCVKWVCSVARCEWSVLSFSLSSWFLGDEVVLEEEEEGSAED